MAITEATREYNRAYYQKNRLRQIEANTIGRYKMTPDDLAFMRIIQGDRCAMCRSLFGEKAPNVDHDHDCCPGRISCGECVRGLLCTGCNLGLGKFEKYETMAGEYLQLFG